MESLYGQGDRQPHEADATIEAVQGVADTMHVGNELAVPNGSAEIPEENRGWEDTRLRMSAHELVRNIRNVGFRPYGSVEETGIQELRDVYMSPRRLAESGVIAHEDTNRLSRDLRETFPDLPEMSPSGGPDPKLAAFLYETADEVPADLVMAQHVQGIMGHMLRRGQRVTMLEFLTLLKERTGLTERLPKDLFASMDAMEAAEARAGRRMSSRDSFAIDATFEFIEKFEEARLSGGRPPRADSNQFSRL